MFLTEAESLLAFLRTDGITLAKLLDCHFIIEHKLHATNIVTNDSIIAMDVEVSANRTYWIDIKEKVSLFTSIFDKLDVVFFLF